MLVPSQTLIFFFFKQFALAFYINDVNLFLYRCFKNMLRTPTNTFKGNFPVIFNKKSQINLRPLSSFRRKLLSRAMACKRLSTDCIEHCLLFEFGEITKKKKNRTF